MAILATGGAGYIGSHVSHQLMEQGHQLIVLDNLYSGHGWAVPQGAKFIKGDVGDTELVTNLIREYNIDSVVHFAAHIEVEESVRLPAKYYENNSFKALRLFETCARWGVKNIIFSSTAAVYAESNQPLTETSPLAPSSPYGFSKLMAERMLQDLAKVHPELKFVILRYFNVAGASRTGRIGQATRNATHLIKVACEAAIGLRSGLKVFGTDYPTHDGTCVRDYIHVEDLSRAHWLALSYLREGGSSEIFNCGYGHGYSVKDVIAAVKRVSEVDFPVDEAGRRPGDASETVASSQKIQSVLGWRPEFDDLEFICKTALVWEKRLLEMKQVEQSSLQGGPL